MYNDFKYLFSILNLIDIDPYTQKTCCCRDKKESKHLKDRFIIIVMVLLFLENVLLKHFLMCKNRRNFFNRSLFQFIINCHTKLISNIYHKY